METSDSVEPTQRRWKPWAITATAGLAVGVAGAVLLLPSSSPPKSTINLSVATTQANTSTTAAGSSTTTIATGSTTTTAATDDASTPSWANQGSQIQTMHSDHPTQGTTDGGNWVVKTNPVDITGPGTYTLDAPMPSGQSQSSISPTVGSAAQPIAGMGFNFPPDTSSHFTVMPGPYTSVTTSSGEEIQVQIKVTSFTSAYPNFWIWLSS